VPGRKTLFDLHYADNIADVEGFDWKPDDALWVHDPNAGRLGGNQFVTADWITKEAMKILENNLRFQAVVNRADNDITIDEFGRVDIEGDADVLRPVYEAAQASAYHEGGHAFIRLDFTPGPPMTFTAQKVKL
jgi:hypothetical protein